MTISSILLALCWLMSFRPRHFKCFFDLITNFHFLSVWCNQIEIWRWNMFSYALHISRTVLFSSEVYIYTHAYTSSIIDVCATSNQQLRYFEISIMCCDMQWSKTRLKIKRYIYIRMSNSIISKSFVFFLYWHATVIYTDMLTDNILSVWLYV